MSIFNLQKTVTPARIGTRGTAEVTLSFDAAAGIAANPADLILIMDRSCSMKLQRMFQARAGARALIRTVVEATAPAKSTTIGCGTRIGIVSFSSEATQDMRLTNELRPLTTAITVLSANGQTNHSAAFEAAERMLKAAAGTSRKIAVLFTGGQTTVGGDAVDITTRMKAQGIEIYCIGLIDDPSVLEKWASTPLENHVVFTTQEKELKELFLRVAAQVIMPGATNIVIREQVSPDFRITAIRTPTPGTAWLTDDRNLVWTMESAGLTLDSAPVSLRFEIQHIGAQGGQKSFNQSLTYEDREGHVLTFPNPTVTVCCGEEPVYPEPCPVPTDFTLEGCQGSLKVPLNNTSLLSLGRIAQLNVTLKSVCPGRRLAVSVILYEISPKGEKLPRGVRHLLVPAQEGTGCRDVTLGCISFALPEALNPASTGTSICPPRNFQAQVIANYVDTDYICCEGETRSLCSCTVCDGTGCTGDSGCSCTPAPPCPEG